MGSLRTLFALSVMLLHEGVVGGLIGGKNAVQLFYIISGFLISFILVERGDYRSVVSFYLNRVLRLYPIYAAVALLALFAMILLAHTPRGLTFFDIYRSAPGGAVALLVASNVLLIGQDWVHFLAVKGGAVVLSSNFMDSDVGLYKGLLVPQAWTLGLELTFYALAPFILKNRSIIYALLASSLLIRAYLYFLGIGDADPWSYRFFPAELALFLCGALAHQLLLPIYRRASARILQASPGAATFFIAGFALAYPAIPLAEGTKTLLLFGSFIVLVPWTFMFQDRHPFDRWIGELSYPLYINHMLVFHLCAYSMKRFGMSNQAFIDIVAVAVAIVVALLLNRWIADPVERIRRRIKSKGREAGRLQVQHASHVAPTQVSR
jgi:peptidoglycan/LPS O-acetylase OafA/YrhL